MLLRLVKTYLPVLFITLIALISLRIYFRSDFPVTHDGENHLARFANYKLALKEGQIPPRWAPNLANGFGYPVFNYNYPLANILSVPFSVIKVSYEVTFKILVITAVFSGLVGTWLWLSALSQSTWAKVAGLATFGLNPYLINALFFRGNIGEILALSLLPWLCWQVEVLRQNHDSITFKKGTGIRVVTSFVWMAFFLSHNVSVLLATPLILIYGLLRLKRTFSQWLHFGLSFILGLGASLWFWLPAFFEKSLVVLDKADLSLNFKHYFSTVHELLWSRLGFGFTYPGSIDTLSTQLGLAMLLILVISIAAVIHLIGARIRKTTQITTSDKMLLCTLIVVVGLCWLQLSSSSYIWQIIPIARFVQFPWRLMLLISVLTPLLTTLTFDRVSSLGQKSILVALIIQAVIVLHLKPVAYFHKTNPEYDGFPQTTSTLNENLPSNYKYGLTDTSKPTPEILEGQGTIEVQRWQGTRRQYIIKADTPVNIIEPTMMFAGWQTTAASLRNPSQEKTLNHIDSEVIAGRLAYQLEPGEYQIESRFTQHTWPRLLGNSLSLIAITLMLVWASYSGWLILSQLRKTRTIIA